MTNILLDASALRLLSCSRRYAYRILHELDDNGDSNEFLQWGNAFHRFAELFHDPVNNGNKSVFQAALATACAAYNLPQDALADAAIIFARYNLSGRTIAVEQKFSITYGEVTTPADTYTITLCGTIDRIADIGNGQYHITDYKTSAKRTTAEVLQGYDLSMQLHFYLSAARYMYPDATLIQGSYLGIFRTLNPPKVIAGQVTSEDFARSPEYANLLAAAVRTIVSIHDNRNQLPNKEGMIYGICEKCPYVRLCAARTVEEHDGLYRRWPRNGYNPLSFR